MRNISEFKISTKNTEVSNVSEEGSPGLLHGQADLQQPLAAALCLPGGGLQQGASSAQGWRTRAQAMSLCMLKEQVLSSHVFY